MKVAESARLAFLQGVALSLAVCTTLVALPVNAADSASIEGMWKIAGPQGSFSPEGGAIPFTADGRKRYQQNKRYQAQGLVDKFDYATSRCASPGLPRLMINPGRLRVWQRPGTVMITFEWNRQFRQIDMGDLILQRRVGAGAVGMGGAGDEEALVGRAIPISKGKWEGDTLVVTTDGFADNTLIDDLVPHGFDMKLTERIRLRDQDTLEDRITIEDPEYFSKPWQTMVTYKRQPDEAFPEHVCLDSLKLEHWPPAGKGR